MVRTKVVRLGLRPDRAIRDGRAWRWRTLRTAAMVTGRLAGRVRDVD
jgi:hypothetical protein